MYDGAALVEAAHHAEGGDPGHGSELFHATAAAQARPQPAAASTHAPEVHRTAAADQPRPAADAHPAGGEARQVYVIDQSVSNWQSLVGQLPKGSEVIVLDDRSSGLDQLASALKGQHDIGALHIISHGSSDAISLGTDAVNASNISSYAGELGAIGASLSANGDILLYGCDVAAQDHHLISQLSSLTQAEVAASTDDTGAASRGGDWTLEASTGHIDAKSLSLDYDGLLAAPTVATTAKSLGVAEPSVLNAAGASTATLSGWSVSDNGNVTVSAVVHDPSVGTLASNSGGTAIANGYSFTGTAAQAASWLNQLTFTAADVELGTTAATTSIDVSVKDVATSATTTKSLAVTVAPSNDPTMFGNTPLNQTALLSQNVDEIANTVITAATLGLSDPEVTQGSQSANQQVYDLAAAPTHGYLTLDGVRLGVGSTFTQQDVVGGKLVYVHTDIGSASQDTADSFGIQVNDGATPIDQSAKATVTLDITPVNQAPTVSGAGTVYESQPANAAGTGAVGNYIVANGGGDDADSALTLTLTSLPTDGTLYFTGTVTHADGSTSTYATPHAITGADIVNADFSFAYTDRGNLTYANTGLKDNQGTGSYPGTDSFGVTVTDAGGGAGVGSKLSASATVNLDVHAVDDDPTLDGASTLDASVPGSGNYAVTLTPAMLGASDVDTPDSSISFAITQASLDQGYLVINGKALQAGSTFSMADVAAGRVSYVQTAAANAGDTDSFHFQLVDNTTALRWNPDGSTFSRVGGDYTGSAASDPLQDHVFTIHLAPLPTDTGDSYQFATAGTQHQDSSYAGVDPSGSAIGSIAEGGTIVLGGTGAAAGTPYLSYTATGNDGNPVDPAQVIYTFTGFTGDGAGTGSAGTLQKFNGTSWTDISPYGTFTQADLNAGNIRFQHDGDSEDFATTADFSVSAGVVTVQNGQAVTDQWSPTFNIYITPTNDAPTVTGSSNTVIKQGDIAYLTTGQLQLADPDDATSESYLENPTHTTAGGDPALADGSPDYAVNNTATGADALKFLVTSLPTGGTLQYSTDGGSNWQNVTANTALDASLITGSASSTGLRFVSNNSEVRSTSFTVRAQDRWGATSATDGTVGIQITNVNDAPEIASDPTQADPSVPADSPNNIGGAPANNPLTVAEGGYGQITSALLQAYDPDSTADQVQYTITTAPAHGQLAYSTDGGLTFHVLGPGSSFTQQDIADGKIYFLNDGTEATGSTPPGSPDDKFTFTVSDGDKEQAGNQFWLYTDPTNDAPVVTAPGGPINLDSSSAQYNQVPGFSVDDPDLATVTSGETDYLQVTVRLLNNSGTAFAAGDYSASGGVTIGYAAGSGASVDASKNGSENYLVLSGTRAQVNAALAGLTVTFGSDRDALYQVQVIADDRLRDGSGNLVGGANGGTVNQSTAPGTGTPTTPVDATNYDWYTDNVPATSGNLDANSVTVRASSVNEPGTLTGPASGTVYEDQPTFIGGSFVVSDPESAAFDTPITVTVSVPSGTLGIGGGGVQASATASAAGSQAVTLAGDNTGSLTLTGRASDIQALLNDSALGLTYQSAANVNNDLNGAAAGDVTVNVHFDDTGSNIGGDTGSGSAHNNPPDIQIALDITAVNDSPTVAAGSGTVYLVGTTAVGGFTVNDVDYTDGGGITTGETDFMQATVRVTDAAGNALAQSAYADITLGSSNSGSAGATVDATYSGANAALVIRGTRQQVNDYLAGLEVTIGGSLANADQSYRVQVIADDRLRDASGNLDGSGAANGGQDIATSGSGTQAVPTTTVDPYAAIPSGLTQNVSANDRVVFPTDVNDPAQVKLGNSPTLTANEGGTTVTLPAIAVTDPDSGTDALQVTVSLPTGLTFNATGATAATVGGLGTGTLSLTGSQTDITNALNGLKVNLPDAPGSATAADWNGAFQVTVVVNDQGNHGSRPATLTGDTDNPNADPGDYRYADGSSAALVTTRTFAFTVNPVNDAPVVNSATPQNLAAANEDSSPAGATVGSLFAGYFNDSKDQIDNSGTGATGGTTADTFYGVAINNLTANPAQGAWEYSTDGGTSWTTIGNRSDANALVLDSTALVRFRPAANYFGTPAPLTARLVENNANGDASTTASVPASGTQVDLSGATAKGGTARYSAGTVTLQTSIANVNDQPTLNATTTLTINEDTPNTTTAGQIVQASYSDLVDNQSTIAGGGNAAGALGYVAITGNDTDTSKGHWEYSTDGGNTWTTVPTSVPNDSNALVLSAATPLRFVPTADYNGAVPGGLTIRVSDSTAQADTGVAAPGTVQSLAGIDDGAGSTSHWSKASLLNTAVTAVQDAFDDTPPSQHVNTPIVTNVFVNDTFANPDKAVTAVTQGAHGTVTFNPNGTVTYTPNNGYTGTDSYTYTVTSGGVTETATVTVNLTNAAPAPTPDSQSVLEDNTATGNVLANDGAASGGHYIDGDGDTLAVTQFTVGGQTYAAGATATLSGVGTLVINTDGSYAFTPVADWNGTVPAATYTVSDGTGATNATATSTLALIVAPVRDAFDDSATTHANTPVSTDVFVNDTFANPDKAVTAVTQGAHGTVTFNPNGTVTYTPNNGYTGTDSYTYTVTSGGVTETATVTVNLTNAAPAPTPDSQNVLEDNTATGNVLANDGTAFGGHYEDADHDTLSVTQFVVGGQTYAAGTTATLSGMGTLVINADGSYAFTPVADWNGTVPAATYTVSDGTGASNSTATSTLALTVTPVQDANNDNTTTHANTPVTTDVLGNDSFSNPDKSVTGVTQGAHGSVVINPDNTVTYTPNPNYLGPDSYTYTVTSGGVTETATVTVDITNRPPVAQPDTGAVTEDGPALVVDASHGVIASTGSASGVDSDPDGDALTVVGVSAGQAAAIGDIPTTTVGQPLGGTYGALTLNTDGSYQYVLDNSDPRVNALKAGQTLTDTFSYAISDGLGGEAFTTLTITINGTTDGTPSIEPHDGNGAGNGTATDGDATVYESGLTTDGPAGESKAATDTIAILAKDGLASITVGTTTLSLADLGNLGTTPKTITTPDGTLVLTGFTATAAVGGVPTAGTLSYTYTLGGALGQPNADHSTDTIALGVTDAGGGISSGTLVIDIVDDVPTAHPDTASVDEDATPNTVTGNVVTGTGGGADGIGAADRLGADGAAVGGPVTGVGFGTTTGTVGSALQGQYGALTLNSDGSYSYALDNANPTVNALKTGDSLTDTYSYTITDADGDTSTTTLTVTIHGHTDGGPSIEPHDGNGSGNGINSVGDATVYESGLTTDGPAGESQSATDTIAISAPDGLASIAVGGTTLTTAQLASLSAGSPVIVHTPDGTLTLIGFDVTASNGGVPTAGTLNYTYALNGNLDQMGTDHSTDTIPLTVTDVDDISARGNLVIDIVDDTPTANADTASVTEDGAPVTGNVVTGTGTGSVADRTGADATATPVSGVIAGTSTGPVAGNIGSGIAGQYGTLTLNSDGSYSYAVDNNNATVNALKTGQSLTDTYSYTITDADGDTSTTTLTVTVHGHTDGTPTIAPVDGNGGVTGQATVSESGLIDGSGTQSTTGSIDLSAPDGLGSVTVGGTTLTTAQLAALSGGSPVVIATPDGTLTLTGFTPGTVVGGVPTSGSLSYSYTLDHPVNQPGLTDSTDTIALTVTDVDGSQNRGSLAIDIVDDVPTAKADTADVNEDGAAVTGNVVTGTGSGSVADRTGADATTTPVSGVIAGTATGPVSGGVGSGIAGQYGTLTLNSDGSYSYAIDNNNATVNALKDGQSLTDTYSYTITDADGDTSTTTLTVTVHGHTDGTPTIAPIDGNGGVNGQATVSESGLIDGSGTQSTTGSIDLSAPDGLGSVTVGGTTLTTAQLAALSGGAPVVIATPDGTLTLTGFTPGTVVGGVPTSGSLSYSYTLDHPVKQPGATDSTDTIALTVTDVDGSQYSGNLAIDIVNDVPTANPDTAAVEQDLGITTTAGNVFQGTGAGHAGADRIGADGPAANGPVTGVVSAGGVAGHIGAPSQGAFGTLTLQADGSYTYVLDVRNPQVASLDANRTLSEVFVYTITDADGDTSQATLTITIGGLTPPIQRHGDQIFPIVYDRTSHDIRQNWTPGLFILSVVHQTHQDTQLAAAALVDGDYAIDGDAVHSTLLAIPQDPENDQYVLRDGVGFSQRMLADIRGQHRVAPNDFGLVPSPLWDDFSPFTVKRTAHPQADKTHGDQARQHGHHAPKAASHAPDRAHGERHAADAAGERPMPPSAPAAIVIPPPAAAPAGAPSLSMRVAQMALAGAVPRPHPGSLPVVLPARSPSEIRP
jgi:VCBS repeat-containing protein